jgi:hypothetical protein
MPNKTLVKFFGIGVTTLSLTLFAMPAYAGFQYVKPSDNSAQTSAPAATTMPEIITPVIISGDNGVQAAPMAPVSSVKTDNSAPTSLATATIVMPAASDKDVVQGFAAQIPLGLALRQVLPPGYTFSIDPGVSADTLVSYKGGKPWRQTVQEMLAPVGLTDREQGMSVVVMSGPSLDAVTVPGLPIVPVQKLQTPQVINAPMPIEAMQPSDGVMPSATTTMADNWAAQRGDTLRKVLTEWCHRSNVELQWQAEYDYPIEGSVHFNGGFEDAVRGLLAGFDGARPQPTGELHTNSKAGQMVLVVQARGNNYSN